MTAGGGLERAPTPRGRRARIDQAVASAVKRWHRVRRLPELELRTLEESRKAGAGGSDGGVRAPLPRRAPFATRPATGGPSHRERVVFKASLTATFRRLALWLFAGWLYLAGTLFDVLRRRNTAERRAVRLRRALERIGGTFLKVGQQLSIRADLLPMVYCMELSKLLDQVPPFSSDQAVAVIERALGRPLDEVFETFDPEPIGSASIACVYQAVVKGGDRVAVKVRRPGIAETFAADWRALSWIVNLAELLTVVRPGQLGPTLRDLETMFLDELDFRKEARYTDLFHRRAESSRLSFMSAPAVYFELSTGEVLVTEFVSGIWLWELLGAVESRDEEALALIRGLDIEPETVARHLFTISLFGLFENLIFHADPHPANVVIRPGSEIVLIDFGSCGSYTERQVHVLRQLHYYLAQEDVGGMVQCTLALIEPLPPVDVDALTRYVEGIFAESLFALRSGGSEWWERTTAGIWIGFMKVARQFHIPVHLDTLLMIRATLQYDTIALRLDPEIDVYGEYQKYRREMAGAARRRFRKRLRRFIAEGLDDGVFLRLEELLDLGGRLTYSIQRYVDSPVYRFSALAGKAVFAASSLLRWATLTLAIGAAGVVVRGGWRWSAGAAVDLSELSAEVAGSSWFLTAAVFFLAVNLRRVLFRFADRDV